MAIAIAVIFWVVAGLGVFLAAMRGGRRASADRGPRRRMAPAARTASVVAVAALFVAFGVAIPAIALVHNNDSQAKHSKGGLVLNDDAEHGRTLFRQNCATCHTLGSAKSVGKVGPNLDVLLGSNPYKSNYPRVVNAIKNGFANGNGQMPQELLQGKDATDVAKYVATVAGR